MDSSANYDIANHVGCQNDTIRDISYHANCKNLLKHQLYNLFCLKSINFDLIIVVLIVNGGIDFKVIWPFFDKKMLNCDNQAGICQTCHHLRFAQTSVPSILTAFWWRSCAPKMTNFYTHLRFTMIKSCAKGPIVERSF